jgi:regulator of RNase E activity RraA
MRNEGFTDASIRCLTSRPSPLVGYAVTVRIRSANPQKDGHLYVDRTDWWSCFKEFPEPRVVVVQDIDEQPGTGAFMGEVHGAILQALGCAGVITNGAVRDLPALQKGGLQVFAGSVAVSHAYSHIVNFGQPVEIGGLTVRSGELIHADMHGVINVPLAIAARVPEAASAIAEHERRVLELCQSPDFSVEKLREVVGDVVH